MKIVKSVVILELQPQQSKPREPICHRRTKFQIAHHKTYVSGITTQTFLRFTCLTILLFTFNFLIVTFEAHAELRNGMPADVVLGQPDFNTVQAAGTSPNRFNFTNGPDSGIFSDGSKLVITDYNNNRVLIWKSIPIKNETPADLVLGQPDFVSNGQNQGGAVGANTLNRPSGVSFVNGKLLIADRFNNRAVIFNSFPTQNNASADIAVGQVSLTAAAGGASQSLFAQVAGLFSDGNMLIVSDFSNQRALIFNHIPTVHGASADAVIGQSNFTNNQTNQGGGPGANTLGNSQATFFDGARLFVCDTSNQRVLIFNQFPKESNASASVVLGQPNFSTNTANHGGLSASSLSSPNSVWSNGQMLVVGDGGNNRVLIWKKIPTINKTPADIVLGQHDFTSNAANQGGSANATSMSTVPRGVFSDGQRLFVKDVGNQRVLIFNIRESFHQDLGPQFSQGKAVVGKVFVDWDGNGVQSGK